MDVSESTSDQADDDMEGEVSSSTSQAMGQSASDGTFDAGEPSSIVHEVVVNDLPDTSAANEIWESVDDDGFIEQTEAQQSGVGDTNEDSEPFAVADLADINNVSSESFDNISEEVIPMPSMGDNNELDFLQENILISTTTEMVVDFTSSDNDVVEQSVEMSTSESVEPLGDDNGVNSAYSFPQSSSSVDAISSQTAGPSNSTPSTSHEVIMSTSNPDSTTVESSSLFQNPMPSSSQADVSTTDEISMVSTSDTNPASNVPSTSDSSAENSQNIEVVSSRNLDHKTSPVSQTRSVCSSTSGKGPAARSRHPDPASSSDLQSSGPSQSPQSSNSTDSTSANNEHVENSSLVAKSKVDPVSSTKDAENNPSTSNQESRIDTTSRVPVTAKQLSEAIESLVPSSSTVPLVEEQSNASSEYTDSEDSNSGTNQGPSSRTQVTASARVSNVQSSTTSSDTSGSSTSSCVSVPINEVLTSENAATSRAESRPKSIVPTLSTTKDVTKLVTLPKKDGNVSKAGGKSASTDPIPKPQAKMSALDAIKAAYSSSIQEAKLDDEEKDLKDLDSSKKKGAPEASKEAPARAASKPQQEKPTIAAKVSSVPASIKPTSPATPVNVSVAPSNIETAGANVVEPNASVVKAVLHPHVSNVDKLVQDSTSEKPGDELDAADGEPEPVQGTSRVTGRTVTDAVHPRFKKSPGNSPKRESEVRSVSEPVEVPAKVKKPSLAKAIGQKLTKIFGNLISPGQPTNTEENRQAPVEVSISEPMEIESTSSGLEISGDVSESMPIECPEAKSAAEPRVKKLTLKLKKDTSTYETAGTSAQIADATLLPGNAGQETLVTSGTMEEPKVEKLTLKICKDVRPESTVSEASNNSNQPKITLKLRKDPMTSRTVIESSTDAEVSGKQSEIVSSSAREEPKVGKLTLIVKKDPVTGTSEIVSGAGSEINTVKQMQDKLTMKLKRGPIISDTSTSESTSDSDSSIPTQGKGVEEEKKVEKLTLKLKTDNNPEKLKPASDNVHQKKDEKHEKITLTLKKNPVTSELLVSDKQMSPEVSLKSFERPSKHDADVGLEGETRHEKLTLKLRKDPITSEMVNVQDKPVSSAISEDKPSEEKHEKLTLTLKKDPVTSELVSHSSGSKNLDCELVATTDEPKVAKLTLKLKKDMSLSETDGDKRLSPSEVPSVQGRTACDSSKPEERVEKLRLTLKKDAATSEIIAEKKLPRKESDIESPSVEVMKEEPKLVEKLTLKLKTNLSKSHDPTGDKDFEKVETQKEQSKLDKITLRLTKDANTSEIFAEKLSKKQTPTQDSAAPGASAPASKTEPKLSDKLMAKSGTGHTTMEKDVTQLEPKELSKVDKLTLKFTKDATSSELRAEKKLPKLIEDIVIESVSEMSKEEPKLVEKLTLKIKSHDEAVVDKGVAKSDVTKQTAKDLTSKLDKITLRLTKDATKRAEVYDSTKETASPGSPSVSEGKSQEQEKIKLTFKKDAAWSVQKTKIKHKDSENSQSSCKSDYDESSSDITELPARRQKLDEEKVEVTVDDGQAIGVKTVESSHREKSIPALSEAKLQHPLEAQEKPSKKSNLQLKNLSELSVTAVEPSPHNPEVSDAQSSKGSVDRMREMLAKIGTSTSLSSDLSITLATPTKTSPKRAAPKETRGNVSSNVDDVQIIQVDVGSSLDPEGFPPPDDVLIVTEVVAIQSDVATLNVKQEENVTVAPKKGRGRPRKQALVVTPTVVVAPQMGVDLVVTPVPIPVPVAEPEPEVVAVKVEPVRPKRSCRGDDPVPVVKPKRPRKPPRVVGKRKKRGGWRGGRKNAPAPPPAPLLEVKLEPAEVALPPVVPPPVVPPPVVPPPVVPPSVAAAPIVPPAVAPPAMTPSAVQNFEEETRMSAEGSNSRCHTPARVLPHAGAIDAANEESQGSVVSTSTNATSTPSQRNQKAGRMEIELAVHQEVTVEQIAEYQWPPDKGGEHFMIQEQISEYLRVKSFKRKYPDLTRRPVEMEERTFLTERGLVTESMCDLGLTAVSSAEVLDIMYADFQEKYEEYRRYLREKQAKEFTNRQKAIQSSSTERKLDYKEKAVQSTADWNAAFNRTRRDKRRCVFDLQSFTIHFPQCKRRCMAPQATRVGHYPVALIPGQYTDYYKSYTPAELRYFPLNTVLYGPLKPNERHVPGAAGGSDGSLSDSDDSSSSDDSSDSSSEGTQDTEETGSLAGDTEAEAESGVAAEGIKEELPGSDAVLCKVCSKDLNKEGNVEVLINCSQCTTSVHPSCLDLTLDMVPHVRRYDWQCTDCKNCILCKDPADEDKMLFCDMCDRGYHIYCVGLRRVPTGRWHCKECAVCGSCGALEPGGAAADAGSAIWQHEYKKGEKGARVYAQTLCVPCSKLWRKGRYCQLCCRCYGIKPEEEGLVNCKACDKWMHSECCNTGGGSEGVDRASANFICEICQEKSQTRSPVVKLARLSFKV